MVLKLTYQNAEALFNLFSTRVINQKPDLLEDQLVLLHMLAVYRKLRNKYEGMPRKTYNISVTLPEAIAYRIYWRNAVSHCIMPYELTILINHCTQIDKELANFTILQPQASKFLNQ